MVDPAYYQQHREEFTEVPKLTHAEHIIHNALHGRLTSSRILCQACGANFGHAADSDFVSLLTPLTARLKEVLLPKQHGKNTTATLQGVLYEGGDPMKERRVEIRGRVVTPKDPYHTLDTSVNVVTIYASLARAKHYKKVVINELIAQGLNPDDFEFRFVEDLRDQGTLGVFFTEGVHNFNERWHLGFNKIALGFAMYAGVDRTQVPRALRLDDTGRGHLVATQNLCPFYPFGTLDKLLELRRPRVEDYYPSHTLILFTQRRQDGGQVLCCYVDLFSTFQYYVLLNDHYEGAPIYKSYHQATTKSVPEQVDLRHIRYKFWNVVAEQFGIDTSKFAGSGMEAYRAFLQRSIDTYQFKPQLTLPVELEKMIERLQPLLLVPQDDDTGQPGPSVMELMKANRPDLLLPLLEEQRIYLTPEQNSYELFRTSYLNVSGSVSLEMQSYFSSCRDLLQRDGESIRQHNHLKFAQLNEFIDEVESLAELQEQITQLRQRKPAPEDFSSPAD